MKQENKVANLENFVFWSKTQKIKKPVQNITSKIKIEITNSRFVEELVIY